MSFVKIDKNNFEQVTLTLKPSTHFISSSMGLGVTGSNFVSPFRSKCLKQTLQSVDATDLMIQLKEEQKPLVTLDDAKSQLIRQLNAGVSNPSINKSLQDYLVVVNSMPEVEKNSKTIDMFRFDQPVTPGKNTNIKNSIRKSLMPYHRMRYDNCHFSYGNYHTLNFFDKGDEIPGATALMYPNINDAYDLQDSFSVNFWINPRYSDTGEYKAGTILHLSSSICVSLVSGSSKNQDNAANDFKILLQLSQSADKNPSKINLNTPATSYPNDLIFTSSHTLSKNYWHHVCIQWSNSNNNSTGSIYIDDNETHFYVNSSSLSAQSDLSPPGLILGNYVDTDYGTFARFFNSSSAELEGFTPNVAGSGVTTPTITDSIFSNPLNAEIHEIKIYDKVLNSVSLNDTDERRLARNQGPVSLDNLKFYVPPFFYPQTPTRQVLVTPFQTIQSKTDDPFNVSFSFGVNGKLINLENFTREFVLGEHPRLLGLTPEKITNNIQGLTADQYVYASGSIKKRNMTILPNDNGLFQPSYYVLESSALSGSSKFYSDPKQVGGAVSDYSIISLENLVPSSSLFPGLVASQGSIFQKVAGSSPENPGVAPGAVLTIAQRTRDLSSNEVVIFDISNLYYGNRIHPGTLVLSEDNLTGSDGKVKIKLSDNGRGSLYRSDTNSKQATWNNVGNVLYDEGMVIIKSPHLFYYGKDLIDVKFKGEQNIHTMVLNVPAFPEMFSSSSNPTYVNVKPSLNANDEQLTSKYITTVNIHDNNFNIIMKANLAQPIIKTEEDEFIIRLKEDF